MRGLLLILVCAAGCVEPNTISCENGDVCPSETKCDTVNGGCIVQAQIDACTGLDADAECAWPSNPSGLCTNGVCLGHVCGDGRRSGPEQCDPTDVVASRTMSTCAIRGYYQGADIACGADCTWDVSSCGEFCGDGVLNGNELCESTIPIGGTCLDFGYDRGAIGCGDCAASFVDCGLIGWKQRGLSGPAGTATSVNGTIFVAIYGVLSPLAERLDGNTWVAVGVRPTIAGADLYGAAIAAVSVTDVWVVGALRSGNMSLGFATHYDGVAWSVPKQFADYASAVYATGASVYVVTGGAVQRYDGTTWSPLTLTGETNVVAVAGSGPNDVWVVGDKLWHGGAMQAFTEVAVPMGSVEKSGLFVLPTGEVLVASHDPVTNLVLVHIRQGTAWTTTTYPAVTIDRAAFYATSVNDIYAVMNDYDGDGTGKAEVAHYDGTRWVRLTEPGQEFSPSAITGSSTAGVVAFDLFLTRSFHYSGSTWVPDQAPALGVFFGVTAVSPTEVYATKDDNTTWRFDGIRWLPSPETMTGRIDAVSLAATYAFDYATQTLWHRTGPGAWTPVSLPATTGRYEGPFAVAGLDDAFFVENLSNTGGAILLRHWNGTAFETTNMPNIPIGVIDCAAGAGCYAVTTGTVWHTPGDRNSWAAVAGTGIAQPNTVWVAPTGEPFIGDLAGLVAWRTGTTWHQAQLPSYNVVGYLAGNAADDVFALTVSPGGGENLFHFDGTSWTEVRMPYPANALQVASFTTGAGMTFLAATPLAGTPTTLYRLERTTAW